MKLHNLLKTEVTVEIHCSQYGLLACNDSALVTGALRQLKSRTFRATLTQLVISSFIKLLLQQLQNSSS